MIENLQKDTLDLKTVSENLEEIVDELTREHNHKVIIKDDQPAAVLVSASAYQELQDRLLALELQIAYQETLEAAQRGELHDWDEVKVRLNIQVSDEIPPKPEGYDEMIPERYRNVS